MGTPCSGPSAAALYWHMGDIQTRLATVSERNVQGSNRALTADSSDRGTEERTAPDGSGARCTIPLVVRRMSNYEDSRTMSARATVEERRSPSTPDEVEPP
ncbi:hypothetical protein GCM10018793_08840 [Streptomyces sulfonofaciens]|uniref:Uncharacterized protein n=1 Tax=Streptomyces sulfonofaciens TaxID=68272 RepID=A0A919KTV1_9ACTN|nr:hypothetical protein GCM10018793_08840 [Streptomyces sulfonofaciens]